MLEEVECEQTVTHFDLENIDDELLKIIRSEANHKLTAYDVIAQCVGLRHVYGNVFKDEFGNKFVRTKYGFQPANYFNKGLQVQQLTTKVNTLETDLRISEKKCADQLDTLTEVEELLEESRQTITRLHRYNNKLLEEVAAFKDKMNRLKQILDL